MKTNSYHILPCPHTIQDLDKIVETDKIQGFSGIKLLNSNELKALSDQRIKTFKHHVVIEIARATKTDDGESVLRLYPEDEDTRRKVLPLEAQQAIISAEQTLRKNLAPKPKPEPELVR